MELRSGGTSSTSRGDVRSSRAIRLTLLGIVAVHLVYPLGAVGALAMWPGSDGSGYASAALALLPVIFLVMALVVGPTVWRTWNGGRLAPWVLAAFVGLEAWLYWNGSRTPSWAEPDPSDSFALGMFVAHALAALAALAVAATRTIERAKPAPGAGIPRPS